MALLTSLGFSQPIQGTRVGRPWRQRLADLLACEVDYAGKTVLDAGCNVGILAYEITKLGPSFIHAIDGSRPVLNAARLILRSVETPHRLDLVNLADDERLRTVLGPSYDIVQLLAVYSTWNGRGAIGWRGACWRGLPSAVRRHSLPPRALITSRPSSRCLHRRA